MKDSTQTFIVDHETKIAFVNGAARKRVEPAVINRAVTGTGMAALEVVALPELGGMTNVIVLGDDHRMLDSLMASVGLTFTAQYPGPEGYVLDVAPDRVIVAGHDSSGTFYGVQSLVQLLKQAESPDQPEVPAVTIVDYPDMPLRSAFYGFYLNALEDDSSIARAYRDFEKMARYKFNRIDLASHHYGHVEMTVPGHPEEKLWQRFAQLHATARRNGMRPRVGGWAKWVNTDSPWGADVTTLECIRTTQTLELHGRQSQPLRIASGHVAPNVIYDVETGRSWEEEPVIVTDASGEVRYEEGSDYALNFGGIRSEPYQKYEETPQTQLEVLFSKVHHGEGEPAGYPLRRGETFNPPTAIKRLPGGEIEDGQRIQVTFSYIGPDPWSILKVRYCRSDPRLHTDGPENYIWRWCTEPVRYWGADAFALDVDETRVFAWDKRCFDSGKSRSEIWVDDIRYYYETIRAVNPRAELFMWSDMLDPGHNAKTYGTEGAADLIADDGMKDIVMIPWKSSIARESVAFFAQEGFAIMPSSQDVTTAGISEAPKWAHWLRHDYSDSDLPYGLMHCHWGYAFESEPTWQQLATVADHSWSVGPYILHRTIAKATARENIEFRIGIEGDRFVFDGKEVTAGPLEITDAAVYYRSDSKSFKKLTFSENIANFTINMDASEVQSGHIEYYIEVSDEFHTSRLPKHAPESLFLIRVN